MPVSLSMVMMALGAFRFGIGRGSYQALQQSAGYRWAKLDRVGRAPALQYLGPDAAEITLSGVIYPHFRGGLRQMELMRAMAGTGVPMILVDGLGYFWKRWAITKVSETRTLFMADGAPRQIEFEVSLQAYGEDFL